MKPVRTFGAVIVVLLLGTTLAWSQRSDSTRPSPTDSAASFQKRIQEQERKLRDLRQQIQDVRARDKALGRKEQDQAQDLRRLEKEAGLTADLLRELGKKEERVSVQIDGIRAEHERATEELAASRRQLSRTLRAMYVRGTPTTAEVVLRASTIRYALSHFKYMELLARNNERLVREIRAQEQYLAATDARLTETLFDLQSNAEEARQEKALLAQSQKARQSALKRVRAQRADAQVALSNLAAAEKQVRSLISTLEERRRAADAAGRPADVYRDVGFAKLRGAMPWPVRGKVITGFGRHKHPKHGTETMNTGIDLAAPEGTPVRCVARGQVEYTSWLDGYGRTVIVHHGGGYYTIYAHLAESVVGEGQPLEPGEILGRVGDSGSLEGAKLHFEVWDRSTAVDPRGWLSR